MRDYTVIEHEMTDEQLAALQKGDETGDFSDFVKLMEDAENGRAFVTACIVAVCLTCSVALVGWSLYQAFN